MALPNCVGDSASPLAQSHSVLVIINFVVITKGATRIAEVAARFT
ncbi:MAG: FHIPEP family type III secretion protein, partial [Cyanothece sp. SIO1E1]|nr:FHIPEP family type III secretion protein [Cyanothece sp. SIO1E1]